ncbi:cold-shock protein [uncultured Kluyvera sp.]|uniref:cold shock small protein YmcF n=1 Tax=uncultured Kluyvera sp. TaxID=286549 RepID=UPI002803C768|nr:cold-shock protein [uncultured Kluyvera sp.]
MRLNIHFRCPCCHGSQYRTSIFDVSEKNPFGAKCIFCKTTMVFNESVSIKGKTLRLAE